MDTALGDLLRRTRLGDEDAATALVERLHPLVRRIAAAHAGTSDRADLVQDVFCALVQRLDRYEPRDGIPFEHWVSRLAVNVCRDALRRERRRPRASALSPDARAWALSLVSAREPPTDAALGAREAVEALLAPLSPSDRLVVTLLHLEERSLEEICALTGWTRGGAKLRAFRARRRLRAAAEALLAVRPRPMTPPTRVARRPSP